MRVQNTRQQLRNANGLSQVRNLLLYLTCRCEP